MQLATASSMRINDPKPHTSLPKAAGPEDISSRPSRSGADRQRQTTRSVPKLGSALGGTIPNAPVFVPAERLENASAESDFRGARCK